MSQLPSHRIIKLLVARGWVAHFPISIAIGVLSLPFPSPIP